MDAVTAHSTMTKQALEQESVQSDLNGGVICFAIIIAYAAAVLLLRKLKPSRRPALMAGDGQKPSRIS